MRLFSYKITHDTGFAPNPFHNVLTLATCKPGIRRTKIVGDWVAGFSSKELANNAKRNGVMISPDALIYLGKVSEVINIANYFLDERFKCKRPTKSDDLICCVGDNIYEPLCDNPVLDDDFEQLQNDNHDINHLGHDLGGKNVLIFDEFYYMGRNGIPIAPDLIIFRPNGPTCYGCKTDSITEISAMIDWVKKRFSKGVNGMPCLMKEKHEATLKCGGCG